MNCFPHKVKSSNSLEGHQAQRQQKMKLALTTSLLLNLLATERMMAEAFSYDPQNPLGPANWDQVAVDGNSCGGEMQSGFDIPAHPSCVYDAYDLQPGNCTIGGLTFIPSATPSRQVTPPTDPVSHQ
jgi:hypothetical protein